MSPDPNELTGIHPRVSRIMEWTPSRYERMIRQHIGNDPRRLRLFGIACYQAMPEIHPKEIIVPESILRTSINITNYCRYYAHDLVLPLAHQLAEKEISISDETAYRIFNAIDEHNMRYGIDTNTDPFMRIMTDLIRPPYPEGDEYSPEIVSYLINLIVNFAIQLFPGTRPTFRPSDVIKYSRSIQTRHAQLLINFSGEGFNLKPEYKTQDTVSLARHIYETGQLGSIRILADALADAGCEEKNLLMRMRNNPERFPKGNYVCDYLLDLLPPPLTLSIEEVTRRRMTDIERRILDTLPLILREKGEYWILYL